MPEAILRLPKVAARTGLSRSSIYERIKSKTFPTPVSIGPRAVGWVEREVSDWIEQRIRASRGQEA